MEKQKLRRILGAIVLLEVLVVVGCLISEIWAKSDLPLKIGVTVIILYLLTVFLGKAATGD